MKITTGTILAKMKKVVLLFLSIALIACSALALVGCGDEHDGIVKISVNQSTVDPNSGKQSAVESTEPEASSAVTEESITSVEEAASAEQEASTSAEQETSSSRTGGLINGGVYSAH